VKIQSNKCAENITEKENRMEMISGICSSFLWFSFPLFSSSLLYFVPSSRWISCLLSCRIINPETLISCSPFAAETALEDGTKPSRKSPKVAKHSSPVRERGRRKLLSLYSVLPLGSPSPFRAPFLPCICSLHQPLTAPCSAHALTAGAFQRNNNQLGWSDGMEWFSVGSFEFPPKFLF